MKPLIVFGTGGMGRETAAAVKRFAPDSYAPIFAVDEPEVSELFGCPVIAAADIGPNAEIVIAIGSGAVRRRIADRFDAVWPVLVLDSFVGDEVEIREGGLICPGSMLTASVRIGRHFQCNVGSYVMHDCVIGDFVTFAPRVQCNGNVHIGDGAYVGAGALLKNGTSNKPLIVGAGAVVGMGAVVISDVPPGATVVGNPARIRA